MTGDQIVTALYGLFLIVGVTITFILVWRDMP
jgi:hypothetical protein